MPPAPKKVEAQALGLGDILSTLGTRLAKVVPGGRAIANTASQLTFIPELEAQMDRRAKEIYDREIANTHPSWYDTESEREDLRKLAHEEARTEKYNDVSLARTSNPSLGQAEQDALALQDRYLEAHRNPFHGVWSAPYEAAKGMEMSGEFPILTYHSRLQETPAYQRLRRKVGDFHGMVDSKRSRKNRWEDFLLPEDPYIVPDSTTSTPSAANVLSSMAGSLASQVEGLK